MNRQLRRAQEKQDKKTEREKARRKASRRSRTPRARRSRPSPAPSGGGRTLKDVADTTSIPKSKMPGRFSGALVVATVVFIALGAVVPSEETSVLNSVVGAGFYLLLGYFLTMWLLRRGTPRAVPISVVSGVMLALGVEVARVLRPEYALDPIMLGLVLPAAVGGALLGRLVYFNTPVR